MRYLELILLGLLLHTSCISSSGDMSSQRYDANEITVQLISLFNQQKDPKNHQISWKGDWVFRRQRLALFDQGLSETRADVIILQEVLNKKNNPSESDQSILQAGSLASYYWQGVPIKEYSSTFEEEKLAVAVGFPFKIGPAHPLVLKLPLLTVSVFTLLWEQQKTTLFNVLFAPEAAQNEELLAVLEQKISQFMAENNRCMKRLMVAGVFPFSEDSLVYKKFKSNLALVDTAKGFCDIENRCNTASSANELFLAVEDEAKLSRTDRVFVNHSALVSSGTINFTEGLNPEFTYYKKYSLTSLWVSHHYGWISTVRLSRCEDI